MTANATDSKGIDELFDEGVDMTPFIKDETARFPEQDETTRKINISMPVWMIDELDTVAKHYGNTRQGMINVWIGERLKRETMK